MKYQIGESVKLKNFNSLKLIVDLELISDVEIYYFSDGTSCSLYDISEKCSLENFFCSSLKEYYGKNFDEMTDRASKKIDEILENLIDKNPRSIIPSYLNEKRVIECAKKIDEILLKNNF